MRRGMLFTSFVFAGALIASGVVLGWPSAATGESLEAPDASTEPARHSGMRRPGWGAPGRQAMQPDDRPEPRRPRGDGSGWPGRPPVELNAEQRQQLLAFVAEHFPFLHERLADEAAADRPAAGRLIRRLWPLYETYQRNPELGRLLVAEHKLEFRLRQAARSYRSTDDEATRQELRSELEKLLREQFDVQTERRALELKELEARLAAQKRRLEHRREARDQTVSRRLEELTTQDRPGRHQPDRRGDDRRPGHGPEPFGPGGPGKP